MTIESLEIELERIFNLSLDMICTAGFDGYFKKINPSFTRILGFSEEELLAKPFIEFVHPDDVASTLAEVEKLSDGVTTLEFVNRYQCKDGTYRWLEWTSNPDSLTETLYAVAHDITEKRKMEEQLSDAERQLRLSYDNAAIGMAWVESDGGYLRVNKEFCKLLGYSEEELLEMIPEDLSHPEDIEIGTDVSNKLVAGDIKSAEIEKRYIHKDGRIIHLRFHVVFIHNDIIGAGYYFTQIVDISEKKKAEEMQRRLNEELESIVEERTQELKEAQHKLFQKQRLATLGQISGGIGHELRNPLGAIKNAGFLLNLIAKDPTDEFRETLGIIDLEIANCERIISSLLNFTRPKQPQLQKVFVNETLKLSVSRLMIPDGIEIVFNLSDDLPFILGDPTQIEMVVSNLVSNAIQSMPKGGKVVIKSRPDSEELVAISIADTGEGIPEENLTRIFEPLFTTKAKGIGLGLALARTAVESHNGMLSVTSQEGSGTTFEILLPISHGGRN